MKANKAIYKKERSAKRRIAKKYFYSVWLRFLDYYILNWFDQWFIYLVLLTELLFESIFPYFFFLNYWTILLMHSYILSYAILAIFFFLFL